MLAFQMLDPIRNAGKLWHDDAVWAPETQDCSNKELQEVCKERDRKQSNLSRSFCDAKAKIHYAIALEHQ